MNERQLYFQLVEGDIWQKGDGFFSDNGLFYEVGEHLFGQAFRNNTGAIYFRPHGMMTYFT